MTECVGVLSAGSRSCSVVPPTGGVSASYGSVVSSRLGSSRYLSTPSLAKTIVVGGGSSVRSPLGGYIDACGTVGAFFSSTRAGDGVGPSDHPHGTQRMTGSDYVERLLKQQEHIYHKKLPFERSQYH